MKGRVGTISFVEPHVRLTIETTSSGSWEAEWTSPNNLMRGGVGNDTLHIGDLLEIEGSPARDPNRRVVSALREIRRPADGWRWTRLGDRGSCISYYRVRASQATSNYCGQPSQQTSRAITADLNANATT